MNKLLRTFSTLALLAAAGGAQAAGTPSTVPAPGQYRVDSELTRTSSAGAVQLIWVQRTDGATGDVTVTQHTSIDPQNRTTQRHPGNGPDLRCFALASPPPGMPACGDRQQPVGPAGSTHTRSCNGLVLDDRWTRLDDRTWEHGLRVKDAAPSAGDMTTAWARPSPSAAADAKRTQALKDLRAKLEAGSRSPNPQDAAAARQALTMMEGGPMPQSPQTGGGVVNVLKERWTRVADRCSANR